MAQTTVNPAQASETYSQASQDLGSFKNKKLAGQMTSWVTDQYQQMKGARTRVTSLWYLNLAFY